MGRFTIAAKHHQTIAEIYESDCGDKERAMQHYEKSADFFRVSTVKPRFSKLFARTNDILFKYMGVCKIYVS